MCKIVYCCRVDSASKNYLKIYAKIAAFEGEFLMIITTKASLEMISHITELLEYFGVSNLEKWCCFWMKIRHFIWSKALHGTTADQTIVIIAGFLSQIVFFLISLEKRASRNSLLVILLNCILCLVRRNTISKSTLLFICFNNGLLPFTVFLYNLNINKV